MVDFQILDAKVRHRRLFPRQNFFCYRSFYHCYDIDRLNELPQSRLFKVNGRALMSFNEVDHGYCDARTSRQWFDDVISAFTPFAPAKVILMAMPKTLGFVFNPVSFWIGYDADGQIGVVVAEVNNTFKERHTYVCLPTQGKTTIEADQWMTAEKVFHVSPFMNREGEYRFKFDIQADSLMIAIHYLVDGEVKLVTSLSGTLKPATHANLRKHFMLVPWVTMKTMILIHWQALKLFLKKMRYRDKPEQKSPVVTRTYE